jgi:MYXO-CTERM domain-containing protein
VFSYWVLTDVFDEDGGTDGIHMTTKSSGNTPFDTVFGLMTFQGMRKAAFNAFKLLNYTGTKRFAVKGGTGTADGVDALVTTSASGDELQILVFNYYKTLATASGTGDNVSISVSNLPAPLANQQVYVTEFLVDETHSNPYDVWSSQGKPASPTETQWQAMRAAQHLALAQPVATQPVTTSFTTSLSLKRQAGALILVGLKRPVTGRNALVEIEGEDYDGQASATKEDSKDETLGQSLSIAKGGYAFFDNVDFSDAGVDSVQLRVKAADATTLELHGDTQTGPTIGSCSLTATGTAWATQTCALTPTKGVQTLYVVPSAALHLNWLKFTPVGGGGQSGTGGAPSGGAGGGAGAPASMGGRMAVGTGGGSAAGGTSSSVGGQSGARGGASSAQGGAATGGGAAAAAGGLATSGGAPSTGDAGGAMAVAGAGGGAGTPPTSHTSGCGCRIHDSAPGKTGGMAFSGLVVLAFARRRAKRRNAGDSANQAHGVRSKA